MWLDRLEARVSAPAHVVLRGGARYGVPYLFEHLARRGRLAWVYLEAPDAGDPVAQGNALAAAVNRALGSLFLPQALPFSYHVRALGAHLPTLGPLRIAVTHAELAPGLADALLGLPPPCQVLLSAAGGLELKSTPQTVLPQELLMSLIEARAAAPGLEESLLHTLWTVTEGAYLDFLVGLSRLKGEQAPAVPSPWGSRRALGDGLAADPDVLLDALVGENRWIEALDLACARLPWRVAGVVAEAGPVYQERGLYERLYLLLASLNDRYLDSACVLEWLLVAAGTIGRDDAARELVEAYLEAHPQSTSLRARYVTIIRDPLAQREEARRLAEEHPDPLTLFQWGRLHPDPEAGVAVLRQGVALAEEGSRAYDAVRNAGALAARLSHTGAFGEARHWGEWALRRFDASGLEDGQRRLRILNDLAFVRLVTGQSAGLADELWEVQGQLEAVLPDLAILFRQTLSELELVEGHPDVALNLARAIVWGAPRRELGKYIVTLVRVLQELGRPDEAAHEAGLALDLSKDGSFATASRLALGMTQALRGEPGAAELLAPVMASPREPAERRVAAALYYLLATGVRFEALEPTVRRLFEDVSGSGLRLLSGPERTFLPVWGQVLAKDMPLRIRALGRREVFWRGERLELTPVLFEILAVLAFFPEGLSLEELHAHVSRGETMRLNTLRVTLSRLRKLVPITNGHYRIETAYAFDALETERLLEGGRLRELLTLYEGPLLLESDVPLIDERRAFLEEGLRRATLLSQDPEVLLTVAKRGEDLELWEAAAALLGARRDPRLALAQAAVGRLRRDYGL